MFEALPREEETYMASKKKKMPIRKTDMGRFLSKYGGQIVFLLAFCLAYLMATHEPAAACAGFLCGPKDALVTGLQDAGDGSADLITRGFLVINLVVLVAVSVPTAVGVGRNVGRDEIGWYIMGSVVIFVLFLGLNFLGDWIFGIVGGAGAAAGGAGVGAGGAGLGL